MLADYKPLSSIPDEALDGPDEENYRSREAVRGKARYEPEGLANVLGNGEVVELKLGEGHEGLESMGVVGEGVVVPCNCLHPYCCHKAEPFPCRTGHLEEEEEGRRQMK